MDRRRPPAGLEHTGPTQPDAFGPTAGHGPPAVYRIRVRGHLDDRWADPREGQYLARETSGDTVLTVPVADQAALHALLRRLRDVGIPLVSINPAVPGQAGSPSREADQ